MAAKVRGNSLEIPVTQHKGWHERIMPPACCGPDVTPSYEASIPLTSDAPLTTVVAISAVPKSVSVHIYTAGRNRTGITFMTG